MADSPKARGLATGAGMGGTGSLTRSPSPKLREGVATCLPRSAISSTVRARTPTRGTRPCHAGPAQQRLPSARTYPSLSDFALPHLTASKGVPGSAGTPARPPGSASAAGFPSPFRACASILSQPDASLSSGPSSDDASGTGRLRRRGPTAFPTDTLSSPEYGLR
jgi:hypothetical protein